MQFFAPDGTRLAYRRTGVGAPLVCVPGGPLLSADYLGDLGGLTDYAELILLDHRGSGASSTQPTPRPIVATALQMTSKRYGFTSGWSGSTC